MFPITHGCVALLFGMICNESQYTQSSAHRITNFLFFLQYNTVPGSYFDATGKNLPETMDHTTFFLPLAAFSIGDNDRRKTVLSPHMHRNG